MSSQSFTSSLGSLNESSSTKYGVYHEPINSNKNNNCYDSSEISSEDSSDEELNTHIGNTN